VLTPRFALRLLAPTVLVSLILVAACTFGALYLDHLRVSAAEVLSENEKSTRAALDLLAATRGLLHILRSPPDPALAGQVRAHDREIHTQLEQARNLANLERERHLVEQIAAGLEAFDTEMARALPGGATSEGEDRPETLRGLADLLEKRVLIPGQELYRYNSTQIEESDRANQAIVSRLKWGLLAVGLGGPLGGLLLGYAMARSLRHSIYQLSVGIRDAAGRLNRELASVTLDEVNDLPELNRQVQGIVAEVQRVVEQLQQREREVLRAEQLAAVGQVAAGVAHELRNPLTSVKMLVQSGLEGQPAAGLPPEDLAVIEHEIRRMEQCIQLFLDFARPPRSERRRTDLVGVVRRALALVEGRARRQNVVLRAEVPEGPLYLLIDPEQIHQVLVNLLLNALDALPRGGTASVRLVRPAGSGGPVEVQVRDTGPGIAPRIRERLFEPFVSSKENGLGLGLSISKRLVEAHGGSVRGENGADGGALFAFTLPV
jgi:signal transduction histidine kinase